MKNKRNKAKYPDSSPVARNVEVCVCCGEETPYDRDDSIDFRNYYIEGAGQLCMSCYGEVYESNSL